MKVATVSFRFRLSGPGVEGAAEQLLTAFVPTLVRPRSMELQLVRLSGGLPAEVSRHKFAGSVDGDVSWAESWGLPPLPGEQPAEGCYTRLQEDIAGPTGPREFAPVLDRVEAFRELAQRQQANREARRAWVVWTFWGLTRVSYPLPSGGLGEGWFLRERLERHHTLVPVLRFICQFGADAQGPFDWRVQTHSHLWSLYSSRYDRRRRAWVKKEDVAAPEENAQRLVRALGLWLLRFPGATFSWGPEREHRPDLTGRVPEVLAQFFGPPHAQHQVAAIPGLRRCLNGHAR
jgi:hypothetical protein